LGVVDWWLFLYAPWIDEKAEEGRKKQRLSEEGLKEQVGRNPRKALPTREEKNGGGGGGRSGKKKEKQK